MGDAKRRRAGLADRLTAARAAARSVGGLRLWLVAFTPADYPVAAATWSWRCPIKRAHRAKQSVLWCIEGEFPRLRLIPFPLI